MKKVGIVTFHFPYNCGAALQCYALQKTLEKMCYDASVIDYRPWYHQNRYTPLKNPVQVARSAVAALPKDSGKKQKIKTAVKSFAKGIYSWRKYFEKKPQDDMFRSFSRNYLKLTKTIYRTIKKLRLMPPRYSAYVSGSDQLWNAHLTGGGFDEVYFLKFGDESVRRITYAVGADFSDLAEAAEKTKVLLKDLNAIALREDKYIDMVKKSAPDGVEVCQTLDPTFLLNVEEYNNVIPDKALEKDRYILTYTMPDKTQGKVYNAAKILSERIGLKVIDVSGNPTMINKKMEDNRMCGPLDFLWYMKNADYVLTNSFHGTAFSVIMQKEFCAIPHSLTGNRVSELLSRIGLTDRCAATGDEAAEKITQPIDYRETEKLLAEERQCSLDYLKRNLP